MKFTSDEEVKIRNINTGQIVSAMRSGDFCLDFVSEDAANGTHTRYSSDHWIVVEYRKWFNVTDEITVHTDETSAVRFEHDGKDVCLTNGTYRLRAVNDEGHARLCFLIIERLDVGVPK